MTFRREQCNVFSDAVIGCNRRETPGAHQWFDRYVGDANMVMIGERLKLNLTHNVLRTGKCRHEFTGVMITFCIPPNMIKMQMSADHDINGR
jgi:hypothetical protein